MNQKTNLVSLVTESEESPAQLVMEFFEQGYFITETPSDVVLKKSNAAILVVSPLGLLERKIIDACYLIAKENIMANTMHSVDLEYFKWLVSYDSNNRGHLQRSFKKILQTVIEVNIIDAKNPNRDSWHGMHFLSDISNTNGRVFFFIPKLIRESLANPHSYTYLSFRIKNRFTSQYAYILYERCRLSMFRGATDWWPMEEFRTIMNTADLYQQFNDFNKRVISIAIKQINELSDIYVTPDYKTRGRTKTHIRFIIEQNPNAVVEVEKPKLPSTVFEVLKNVFGFSNTEIDTLAAEYSVDYLQDKIEFSLARIAKAANTPRKIERPDRYLIKALKEDLRFNISEIKQHEAEARVAEEQKEKVAEEQKRKAVAGEARTKAEEQMEAFLALDEAEQQHLINEFKRSEYFAGTLMNPDKFNLKSQLIKAAFVNFLQQLKFVETKGSCM